MSVVTVGGVETVSADDGAVSGTIYVDWQRDGTYEEPVSTATSLQQDPIAGATIRVYDDSGALVNSNPDLGNSSNKSGSDGSYNVSVAGAVSNSLRVEVELPADGYERYSPTNVKASNATSDSVRFVALNDADVDFGFVQNGYGDTSNPSLIVPGMSFPDWDDGSQTHGSLFLDESPLVWGGEDGATNAVPETVLANQSQTGAIWGSAVYTRSRDELDGDSFVFTSSYLRRHVALGSGGLGTIYLTNINSGVPNATPLATGLNAGVIPAGRGGAGYDWPVDPSLPPEMIGRAGLGDLDINNDQDTLYVTNLFDKKVYEIRLTVGSTPAFAGSAAVVSGFDINTFVEDCPISATPVAGEKVPMGMDFFDGELYVAVTCTGPAISDLEFEIRAYDPISGSWRDVVTAPLDYPHDFGYNGAVAGVTSETFQPWSDAYSDLWKRDNPNTVPATFFNVIHAQPLVSDITVNDDGYATVAVRDRVADIIGFDSIGRDDRDPNNIVSDGTFYRKLNDGDVLMFAVNNDGTWTGEFNGGVGDRTGVGTGKGPGDPPNGDEFFEDGGDTEHRELLQGSTETVPGYDLAFATGYSHRSAGVGGPYFQTTYPLRTVDGFREEAAREEFNINGLKGNALGELSRLVDEAPVFIGDRVWFDEDRDGIQDPDLAREPSIEGVTVRLLSADGVTEIDTELTDSNGYYQFQVDPGGEYIIQFGIPVDYGANGPLEGRVVTRANADPDDDTDSDAVNIAKLPTGMVGVQVVVNDQSNNFTFDAGFNVAVPDVDIQKQTGVTGNEADVGSAGEYVAAGTSIPIQMPVVNTGTANLFDTTITDKTLVGDDIAGFSCVFPGETTATPAVNGKVTWAANASSRSDRVAWMPGVEFKCSATLSMPTGAEVPHADEVVVAAFDANGTLVDDKNDWNAFTAAIDIVKFDARDRGDIPEQRVDGLDARNNRYEGPTPGKWNAAVDADTANRAVHYVVADGASNTGPQPVNFIITNTGKTSLANLNVADITIDGPNLKNVSCNFGPLGGPSTGTRWEGPFHPGESFECSAVLTLVAGQSHSDTASVVANPIDPTTGDVVNDRAPADGDRYFAVAESADVDIEKVTKASGIDADDWGTGEYVPAGGSVVLDIPVTNTGDVPLTQVVVADTTLAGQSVTGFRCVFPDGSSATPTDLNGKPLSIRWAASFGSSPSTWNPGVTFNCEATLTMDAGDPAHVDRVAVAAIDPDGRPVTDRDDHHDYTSSIDIVKFDGRTVVSGESVVDGPDPANGNYDAATAGGPIGQQAGVDADTTGNAVEYPITGGTTGPQPVTMVVTNTGKSALADVKVADLTVDGPAITGLVCTFPDGSTGLSWAGPFVPGGSFNCAATLTMGANADHHDIASVGATPINPETGKKVNIRIGDEDPYHANTSTTTTPTTPAATTTVPMPPERPSSTAVPTLPPPDQPSVEELPSTGASISQMLGVTIVTLGFGVVMVIISRRRSRRPAPVASVDLG